MSKRSILDNLPECDLIQILAEKASQRKDINFDFLGKLNDFRERVSGEVRQINLLFPEYTPHDEEYHLSKLFHVASLVLGRARLEAMNSTELFILALSLYGHDWGMAVNEVEKEYILTGKSLEDITKLWVLPDEKQRLGKFLKQEGISSEEGKSMPIEVWREYIRLTHALRSGERARKYFEGIDGGIADSLARVSEGHWLDFEDLEDYHQYPPDFAVMRETVNLRALAVYLRLIDLLDLSEDRTPYVIWKFVAPRDPRSKMEWAKHRALRPITCPPYQQGRIIQVDGSTADHEVYAALEDLRIWSEEQLRGCNDILARMNDPRHRLDIYHIDWRVASRGFKPVLIQFEFDRQRMFEILGDDIYQGDPYVFLREFLQNSIDAIRVRREVLKRNRIEPGEIGVIHVNVEHLDNGDAIITWTDDGVGMDEYIVRNYFSVAGKSYYRSSDFEREGLNIDPISRFGIGFLSCFMVAERVEVRTCKEPYLNPPSDLLIISIPAMQRQFRVEVHSREGAEVGTTIRVFIEGNKLPNEPETDSPQPLNITLYLSEIAGLVEFPIVIEERNQKTIIISPQLDKDSVSERFGGEFEIHQLDFAYPWSKAIRPQDLQPAKEHLEEVAYNLSSDLKLEEYEGTISYLIPKNKANSIASSHNGIQIDDIEIRSETEFSTNIHFSDPTMLMSSKVDSRSARHFPTFSVYKDGILISGASQIEGLVNDYSLPIPQIIANLKRNKSTKLNLARTEITDDKKEHWSNKILKAHNSYIIKNSIVELSAKNAIERLYDLGYMMYFHFINLDYLWEFFPYEKIPIAFFEKKGNLRIIELGSLANQPIYKLRSIKGVQSQSDAHHDIMRDFARLLNAAKEDNHTLQSDGILHKWIGDASTGQVSQRIAGASNPVLSGIERIWDYALGRTHVVENIRFLQPPNKASYPLVQEIYVPLKFPEKLPDIEVVLQKGFSNPDDLDLIEWNALRDYYTISIKGFERFSPPFQNIFAFGKAAINTNHPLGKSLLQLECLISLKKSESSFSRADIGKISDATRALFAGNYRSQVAIDKDSHTILSTKLERLSTLIEKNKALAEIAYNIRNNIPKIDEFIPGTYSTKKISRQESNPSSGRNKLNEIQEFGNTLL